MAWRLRLLYLKCVDLVAHGHEKGCRFCVQALPSPRHLQVSGTEKSPAGDEDVARAHAFVLERGYSPRVADGIVDALRSPGRTHGPQVTVVA